MTISMKELNIGLKNIEKEKRMKNIATFGGLFGISAITSLLDIPFPISYLFQIIPIIYSFKKKYIIADKEKNLVEQTSVVAEYNVVLSQLNKLLSDLNLKNPVEIYTACAYLMSKGYISKNKLFYYSLNTQDFPHKDGLDVIIGKGVCGNIGALLSDLYNNGNIVSFVLSVRASDDFETSDENQMIDYKDELEEILKEYEKTGTLDKEKAQLRLSYIKRDKKGEKFSKLFGISNHAITIANTSDKTYILDPTNMFTFKSISNNRIITEGDSQNVFVVPRFSNLVFGALKQWEELKKQDTIDYQEYREFFEQALGICSNNINVFEDFYRENRKHYINISDEVTLFNQLRLKK